MNEVVARLHKKYTDNGWLRDLAVNNLPILISFSPCTSSEKLRHIII